MFNHGGGHIAVLQKATRALAYALLHCWKSVQRPWHMFICIFIKSFSSHSALWMREKSSWKRSLSSRDKWFNIGWRKTLERGVGVVRIIPKNHPNQIVADQVHPFMSTVFSDGSGLFQLVVLILWLIDLWWLDTLVGVLKRCGRFLPVCFFLF